MADNDVEIIPPTSNTRAQKRGEAVWHAANARVEAAQRAVGQFLDKPDMLSADLAAGDLSKDGQPGVERMQRDVLTFADALLRRALLGIGHAVRSVDTITRAASDDDGPVE